MAQPSLQTPTKRTIELEGQRHERGGVSYKTVNPINGMGNKYSSANRKFARYSSRRAGNVTSSTVRFHMLRYLRFMSGILQPYGQGMTDMKPSRIALFAFAAIVGTGTLVGSGQAKAGSLDFLNHMNPQYTSCIASTRANIAPQYRDQRNVHDAIIDNCARRFPPFG